ncbi:MAG TPA: pyridoxamine 5'-phosphate oxidase family protein [Chitinophagaceae bacterium]|jgi:general stress protein 26|nr:pyridoxamine 5'-phosphate oxidase family protein [Chitinophagaceae bacterium]
MEKNLQQNEAVQKFRKLAEEINICMFITHQRNDDHTRPMATIEVEADGTLWFFTDIRSIKVDEITKDGEVHLIYSHPGKESYMDVWGEAGVETDRAKIQEKWKPIVKAWFPNGPEDPNLALLRVRPTDVYYWENETGKMVQFFKIATAMVTGNPQVAKGAEGNLSL